MRSRLPSRAGMIVLASIAVTFGFQVFNLRGDEQSAETATTQPARLLKVEKGAVTFRAGGTEIKMSLDAFMHAEELERCTLLFAGESEGHPIVLLDVEGPSRLNNPDKQCGAGTESDLIWLEFDDSAVICRQQGLHYSSCWQPITGEAPQRKGDLIGVEYVDFSNESEVKSTAVFSTRNPERGLVVKHERQKPK